MWKILIGLGLLATVVVVVVLVIKESPAAPKTAPTEKPVVPVKREPATPAAAATPTLPVCPPNRTGVCTNVFPDYPVYDCKTFATQKQCLDDHDVPIGTPLPTGESYCAWSPCFWYTPSEE